MILENVGEGLNFGAWAPYLGFGTCYEVSIKQLCSSSIYKCNIYVSTITQHRRVQRGGSGGPDPPLFLDPPFSSVTPPPPTQPDLTDKCSVNCFLIV